MGMFDYVIVDYPLPGPTLPTLTEETWFQTKDMERLLDTYIISKEGKLLLEDRRDGEKNAFIKYTGTIKFYTSITSGQWIDFRAKFKNGILKHIKRMYAIDYLEEEIEEVKKSLKQEKKNHGARKTTRNR